ncbi:hypothetical protein G6F42_023823 [Rhizopus arrhizus]|nr:hypothetical protein G6F42_023823 [Rhizopus arrhizus]
MDNKLSAEALEDVFARLRSAEKQVPSVVEDTVEDIKSELEQMFLTPQQSFPSSWLSKCQEHWEETPNYAENAYSQLSKPRTNIEVARKGFDGDIIGFKEVIIDDPNLASNNSTSFSRAVGSTKDFVRGSASQFPFAPGGLDAEVIVDQDDLDENNVDLDVDIDFFNFDGKDSKVIAPGLDRGLAFGDEQDNETKSATNKDSVFNIEDMMAPVDNTFDFLNKSSKRK